VSPWWSHRFPIPTQSPPSLLKAPLGAQDHDVVQAEGQSHAAVKPIRIRLRVNPPRTRTRPAGIKTILRLKGPDHGRDSGDGRVSMFAALIVCRIYMMRSNYADFPKPQQQ
jgi:hypothetical protein